MKFCLKFLIKVNKKFYDGKMPPEFWYLFSLRWILIIFRKMSVVWRVNFGKKKCFSRNNYFYIPKYRSSDALPTPEIFFYKNVKSNVLFGGLERWNQLEKNFFSPASVTKKSIKIKNYSLWHSMGEEEFFEPSFIKIRWIVFEI